MELRYEVVDQPEGMRDRGKYGPLWNELVKMESGKCLRVEINGEVKPETFKNRVTQSLYNLAEKSEFRVRCRIMPDALYLWLSPRK